MGTYAEDYLTLVTDEHGRHWLSQPDLVVAGALTAELATGERVMVDQHKRVTVLDASSTGDALLDEALVRLGERAGQKAQSALPKVGKGLTEKVHERLVRDEVMEPERTTVLGVPLGRRWVPVDPTARDRLRDELVQVLTGAREADARTGTLIALVRATNQLGRIFPAEHRGGLTGGELRRAAKHASEGRWASDAVAAVIASAAAAAAGAGAAAGAAASG